MAKQTFDTKFREALTAYGQKYDIENLQNPNDTNNLHTMIRNHMVIEELQIQMHTLTVADAVGNSMDIKKLNDSIVALAETNMRLEKTLGIDRKTRKQEAGDDPAEYIRNIKLLAEEFLLDHERLLRVYCQSCNIMVGRISPVYDATEYEAYFQCPQCSNFIKVYRQERDVFFDVKDSDWRKKYPVKVLQPKRIKGQSSLVVEDDVILTEDDIE